jgi:chemotaxis protein CheD
MRNHQADIIRMTQTIDVQTGEVKAGGQGAVLVTTAIGSCIAVVALDVVSHICGIAHIMLPGKAPEKSEQPHTRYAYNGFSVLIETIQSLGGTRENLRVCLAGGANVLQDPKDTICRENTEAVIERCAYFNLPVVATSLGGYSRRRILVNIGQLLVSCGIGDQADFILWVFDKEITK